MADFYDYSGINWSNTTLDEVLSAVRAANASGEVLDGNFYEQAAANLSVEARPGTTKVFYAGKSPLEADDSQAWQVTGQLSESYSHEFSRLDGSNLGRNIK